MTDVDIPFPIGKAGEEFMSPQGMVETEPVLVISRSQVGRVLYFDFGEETVSVPMSTNEAEAIVYEILPDLLIRFLRKNAQYARAQTGHDLGIKGIIPDINRKSAALITRIWDANNQWDESIQESTVEIVDDLIGHLLLLREKLT